jgi:NAD(P)-dependent dehydrogenase (short-subunit alcohol dehydrogenase family)
MTRTMLITGSASGIGAATRALLERQGHRVIGVDLRDAEVEADLTTEEGRALLVSRAGELVPDGLDAVLAGAGIAHPTPVTVALNFFGAVETLEGLRPLLARKPGARAVAICSTAALLPVDEEVLQACLSRDEARALQLISERPMAAYSTSKRALSLWLRTAAVSSAWAGAGILLNGIAPGVVETPMSAPLLKDPEMLKLIAQSNPMAVEAFAKPEEMAELIAFMLTFAGHYLLGQIIFNDGGTDALMRPEQF